MLTIIWKQGCHKPSICLKKNAVSAKHNEVKHNKTTYAVTKLLQGESSNFTEAKSDRHLNWRISHHQKQNRLPMYLLIGYTKKGTSFQGSSFKNSLHITTKKHQAKKPWSRSILQNNQASQVAQWVKDLPVMQETGSICGWGRPLEEGHGNPLQYSCLGNPTDRGVWRATVHGAAESATTEWLSTGTLQNNHPLSVRPDNGNATC